MKLFTLAGFLIVILPLLAGTCRPAGEDGSALPSEAQPQIVEIGPWGGDQIGLDVTEAGATVEFSCAHGTIEGSLLLDAEGRFTADGLYVQEHGGPVSENEELPSAKARYEGQVKGSEMSLTVVNLDTQEKIGTFTLVFGSTAKITKCL